MSDDPLNPEEEDDSPASMAVSLLALALVEPNLPLARSYLQIAQEEGLSPEEAYEQASAEAQDMGRPVLLTFEAIR
jgi:hypothetical protein